MNLKKRQKKRKYPLTFGRYGVSESSIFPLDICIKQRVTLMLVLVNMSFFFYLNTEGKVGGICTNCLTQNRIIVLPDDYWRNSTSVG